MPYIYIVDTPIQCCFFLHYIYLSSPYLAESVHLTSKALSAYNFNQDLWTFVSLISAIISIIFLWTGNVYSCALSSSHSLCHVVRAGVFCFVRVMCIIMIMVRWSGVLHIASSITVHVTLPYKSSDTIQFLELDHMWAYSFLWRDFIFSPLGRLTLLMGFSEFVNAPDFQSESCCFHPLLVQWQIANVIGW